LLKKIFKIIKSEQNNRLHLGVELNFKKTNNMLERLREILGTRDCVTVNLVVHESEVRRRIRELKYTGRNPEYLAQLQAVIEEIERVKGLPNTRGITGNLPDGVRNTIKGADQVVIYGCNRRAYLDWVAEEVAKKGIPVALSIRGTI